MLIFSVMNFKYSLDERPPLIETLLYGLQWLAIAVPSILIIGKIIGRLHFHDNTAQIVYLQKMSFVTAVVILFQVLKGHRLPVIAGPASVLLIGIIAGRGFDLSTIYTSILLGGLFLTIVAAAGLFGYLRRFFTVRVVAVVLLLIAFTLTPTIIQLITSGDTGTSPLGNICFAFLLIFFMFVLQKYLRGLWKSTLIVWAMLIGTFGYFALNPVVVSTARPEQYRIFSFFLHDFTTSFSIDPGLFLSFLVCFLALSINDLGSIESMDAILKPSYMQRRVNRGIVFTGIGNILSGFFGIVGPVNYSLSPGVIASTGCASRIPLVPAALLLAILSFSPVIVGFIGSVPAVVIGSVLVYILTYQVATGLSTVLQTPGGFTLETGLVIGLPVLLGTVTAHLPTDVVNTFPATLRPLIGNGFVVGVIAAFILDQGFFRQKQNKQ